MESISKQTALVRADINGRNKCMKEKSRPSVLVFWELVNILSSHNFIQNKPHTLTLPIRRLSLVAGNGHPAPRPAIDASVEVIANSDDTLMVQTS
jgi:hypothetical protein